MLDLLKQPWPWYVAGPMITLTMLLIGYWGKSFGISGTLRTMCAAMGGHKWSDLFDFDWRQDTWNLVFILGAVAGGVVTSLFLSDHNAVQLADQTVRDLNELGVSVNNDLLPESLFGWEQLGTLQGLIFMVGGGFLVGFGTRYAGGCTSGHAITGLSNLQLPSLLAVIGFFAGGLIMTHFLMPYLFAL